MNKSTLLQSKLIRFALPIIVIAVLISIFKNGYAFGQWLHKYL